MRAVRCPRSSSAGAPSRNTTCSSLMPSLSRAGCLSSRPSARSHTHGCRRGGARRLRPCSSPARQPGSKRLTKSWRAATTRRYHQALAGGQHPGVEGVEASIRASSRGRRRRRRGRRRSPRACRRCRRSPPGWVRACRPLRWRLSRPRPGCRSRAPAAARSGTPRPGRGGSAARWLRRGRSHGPERRCDRQGAHRDLQGKGKVLVLGVEVATDSGRVRSCLLIDQTFDRTHVRS